jgi:hypothetical protein
MLDDDLDEAQEPTVEPAAPEAAPDQTKELAELRQENKRLRLERTRESIRADYGASILELVDDDLPLEKQRTLAEKLAGRLGSEQPVQTETVEAVEAPQAEPSEAERNLAAVAKGSASTGSSQITMSEEDVRVLMHSDPTRYAALRATGAIPPPPRIGADRER